MRYDDEDESAISGYDDNDDSYPDTDTLVGYDTVAVFNRLLAKLEARPALLNWVVDHRVQVREWIRPAVMDKNFGGRTRQPVQPPVQAPVQPPTSPAQSPEEWAKQTWAKLTKKDWRLLASAPSLQALEQSIAKYYYGPKKLIAVGPEVYAVERGSAGDLIPSVKVYKNKGRWYFVGRVSMRQNVAPKP
jgi:hypothetical protein